MFRKPLVRTLPFHHISMFYNISCEFFCMVVRPPGLYLLLLLDNIFCHVAFLSYLTSYYYMFHTMRLSLRLISLDYTFIKFNLLRYFLSFTLKRPKKFILLCNNLIVSSQSKNFLLINLLGKI